jgi:Flp pilus assembly pilin Flp
MPIFVMAFPVAAGDWPDDDGMVDGGGRVDRGRDLSAPRAAFHDSQVFRGAGLLIANHRAMTTTPGRLGRPGPPRRGNAGQTVTEYLMILGFITAVIIALTKLIVPAIARGVLGLLEHMVLYVSSM